MPFYLNGDVAHCPECQSGDLRDLSQDEDYPHVHLACLDCRHRWWAALRQETLAICGGCGAYGVLGQPHFRNGEECGEFV